MTLDEYLHANRLKLHEFAPRIGVTPQTVAKYRAHIIRPSLNKIAEIRRATDGAVDGEEWIGGKQ